MGLWSRLMGKKKSNDGVLSDTDQTEEENTDAIDAANIKRCQEKRGSVSAEVYGENNKRTDWTPPVYEKNDQQKKRITEAVQNCFLFSALEDEEFSTLIGAFKEEEIEEGTTLMTEGEEGEKLYLIETGEFEAFKKKGEISEKVGTMKQGEAFGELALMYNAPRAATVTATVDSKVWGLDRQTFSCVVRDAVARRRDMYEKFLTNVELLKDMDSYERAKLSDALKSQRFDKGSVIIEQGETGNKFYILESGTAKAWKDNEEVESYKSGDYFGELALLNDKPRAATVKAVTNCKVVYLDQDSFNRLLGPVRKILKRNSERYHQFKHK